MGDIAELLTTEFIIIVALVAGYQTAFGARQAEITEAVIRALKVKSHLKPLVNIIASTLTGALIGAVMAVYSDWQVIPILAIAGFLASAKAAEVHDAKKTVTVEPQSIKVKPPDEIRFRPDRPQQY